MRADSARSLAPAAATERFMYRTELVRVWISIRKAILEGALHAANVFELEEALMLEKILLLA
jgi:hypothetical protein